MSEADTPNNQPLPEPPASMDETVSQLPDVREAIDLQKVNVSELPDVRETIQPWQPEQKVDLDSATVASSLVELDGSTIEIPDAERRPKDADWFALAQKMRQRNRGLLDQVSQLRAALREKQEELHSELMRSQQRESLLTQQTGELNTLQEQLTRMFQTLESSHQASQRQQILIETLSEQLQSSQERVAQLERECALTQQRYNEQSHQLLQAANTCRELRIRLHRQQQQTLQFKAALEKSLEMPTSSTLPEIPPLRSGSASPSVFAKTQPIQPWSTQLDSVEDQSSIDTLWKRPIMIQPPEGGNLSEVEPFEIRQPQETDLPSRVDSSNQDETAIASSQESINTELELEQQLLAEMNSLVEASGLSEFQSDLAETQAQLPIEPGTSPAQFDNPASSPWDIEENRLPENTQEMETEVQTLSEESWENSVNREPDDSDVMLPQSNWPSPVLYPLRSPKKRKSLAAIELPSFPRYHLT